MWECRSKLGTPDPRFFVSRKLMDCEEHAQIGLHKLLVKQKGNQKDTVRQGWNWSKVFVHTYFHSHTIGLPCPNTDTLTWWVGHCTGPTLTIMIPSQQHFLPQHSIYLKFPSSNKTWGFHMEAETPNLWSQKLPGAKHKPPGHKWRLDPKKNRHRFLDHVDLSRIIAHGFCERLAVLIHHL